MSIWGLHIIDVSVIFLYVIIILWLGKRAAQKTKDTGDFFLAGRKLGKFYQFFLNFGCSTNADQAVAVSREIYRQGIGGMWIQYLVLFLTPFYWFTTFFFRRILGGKLRHLHSIAIHPGWWSWLHGGRENHDGHDAQVFREMLS
jgi:SSS family solute:Na+ symporter